jgi:hypothetical protein
MKRKYSFRLFVESWFFLLWAKLQIQFKPFQSIASGLGTPQFETPLSDCFPEFISLMKTAIRRAAKYSLHKSNCYDQALAAMMLCRKRKIPATIYFGLAKTEEGLKAHAWLRCGISFVTGGFAKQHYTPVAWFGTPFNTALKS